MSSLIGRFQRDITFLSRSMNPHSASGTFYYSLTNIPFSIGKEVTSLNYKGEEFEQLKDSDIQELAAALK